MKESVYNHQGNDIITPKVYLRDNLTIYDENRKYTLTKNNKLYIGINYADDIVTTERDELRAHWHWIENKNILIVDVIIDNGYYSKAKVKIRDYLFRKELQKKLKTIIYGDLFFIKNSKKLDNSKIIVNFKANDLKYNKVESWGNIRDYI